MEKRLNADFFQQDVLDVAPRLIGKKIIRKHHDGNLKQFTIIETEAYRGVEDLACHVSKGRTKRTEVMYHAGGVVYVYLIYGMYWMLNFVTGQKEQPQAVLIRGIEKFDGPGKLTKHLQIDKSFYGENLIDSDRIWVLDNDYRPEYRVAPRVGINYAGEPWLSKPWRYILTKTF